MNINDPKINTLRAKIEAAQQEFDLAVAFHEVWKPAAYDEGLHKRMGASYSTHAFLVVRTALRREMLLALMRLWDRGEKPVGMEFIGETLGNEHIMNALAIGRARIVGSEDQVRQELCQRAAETIALIKKYSSGGSHYAVREKLKKLRDKLLAHRETGPGAVTGPDASDEEIEAFYQDMSELVRLLLSLVKGLAYHPAEAAEVYRHYATLFWAGVRGERTEGHPNYRGPIRVTPAT
jgi:hypothetical protein